MTTVVPTRLETHRVARSPRRRILAVAASLLVLLLAAGMLALAVPVPGLEGFLAGKISDRVRDQVACPGSVASPPTVIVAGHPLLPQVLRGRLGELRLSVPDATLSGVPHAAFTATLHDVSQPAAGTTHVDRMDAGITVGFANLPAPEGSPAPQYHRAPDGGLTVDVVVPAAAAKNVNAKLYSRMEIRGETARSVPQRLQIFGKSVPANQVTDLTGGVRSQQLPHLPAGVTYKSINPRTDGLHVALSGVSTTALGALPTSVGGRTVSYTAADGLLGIVTSAIGVPLTIFTQPALTGGSLTLVPRKVHILGADHRADDPVAKLVLTQVDPKDLVRALPVLPAGVTYRSASVDAAGIKVVISGVTVKPYSALRQPPGRNTTFGAEGGLLTAVAKGGSGEDTPVVLYGRPAIHDSTLDIAPSQVEMFGIRFPAADVLAEVRAQQTTYPLQKLPAGLSYQGVEVRPDGLAIRLTGADVTLTRGALTGGSC